MAAPPFSRAARQTPSKPNVASQRLSIDRGISLGAGLRTALLFEGHRLADIGLPARTVAKRGATTISRGLHGAQARTAVTGSSGVAFTPCLTLAPKDATTNDLTLSALVRFDGTGPQAGSFNITGSGLAGDDTGRMPLYVSRIAGTFRTRVPAETEFLAAGAPPVTTPTGLPNYDHIVMVVMENKAYGQIVGSSAAPYINNTLIAGGRLFTNYTAVSHPSEPNYLALYFGSTFGVVDDDPHSQSPPDLYTVLNAAGKTFIGYDERPTATPLGKHDPWRYAEGTSVERDFGNFPTDFSTLPTVSWVIPNQADDMHDGTIAQGDAWLQANINAYAQWAKSNNSLLILTFDEDDDVSGNHIVTVLYGARVVQGQDSTAYNHYGMLASTVVMAGLPQSSAPRTAATARLFNTSNFSTPTATLSPLLVSSLTGWHRVTVTVSGTAATLYVDGVASGAASQAFTNFTLRSVLGSDVTGGTEWPWPVADLFYWSRALAADEVMAHVRRPYVMLKDRLTERWLTPPVVAAPPPVDQSGDAWDFPFSDEFGPAMAFGVLAQIGGYGRLIANAQILHSNPPLFVAAQLDGGGFLHAEALVLRPTGTVVLSGSGSLTATPIQRRSGASFDAVGTLSADPRPLRSAQQRMDGVGGIRATPGVRYSVRAAVQGVGTLITNPFILEPFNHGRAAFNGAGTLTASAIVTKAPPKIAILTGIGTLIVNNVTQRYAVRPRLNGAGRLIAKARVIKRPRVRPGIAAGAEPDLVAMELETYVPGGVPILATQAHGTRPHGTLSRQPPTQLEIVGQVRASDVGYRTAPTDQGGPAPYPPLLADAYQIEAAVALEPTRTAAAAAWGSVQLANPRQQFDTIALTQNSDGRSLRLLTGSKRWDASRQYFTDPSYAALSVLFSGLAAPWSLTDAGLQIPLRDASYYLEKPLQQDLFGGNGTLDGTPDLAGKPKPMARGGTLSAPIQNVTPVLVDPANLIFQYNDGPGQVVALYEGAATGPGAITAAGDVANLYVGSTPPGQYRTDNSRGLIQLGSVPVAQITADVLGYFPTYGPITNPFSICRYLLVDDMTLPPGLLDTDSFDALAAATGTLFIGGLYFSSDQAWTCVQAIDSILASIGANLIPTRDGRLRVMLLRTIDPAIEPLAASYDETQIISLTHRPLPSTLDPPPYRFRVGYGHNYTVMTSGVNQSLSTATRRQFVASPDRFASWSDVALLRAYRRPNDFQPMPGPLLTQQNAQDVANAFGRLWGVKRQLYDITLPRREWGRDIGDRVHVRYPVEKLSTGGDARVVGYALRATDATVTYTVLV